MKDVLNMLMKWFANLSHGLEIVEIFVVNDLEFDVIGGRLKIFLFWLIELDAFLKVWSSLPDWLDLKIFLIVWIFLIAFTIPLQLNLSFFNVHFI